MLRRLDAGPQDNNLTPNRKNTMNTIKCPHCSRDVETPQSLEDRMHWDGRCECGRSIFDAIQPEDVTPAPKIYTTRRDYITQAIHPALEDNLDDYDVDGIAETMLVRHNRSGLVERQDVWFWDVVADHELPPAATTTPSQPRFTLTDAVRGQAEVYDEEHGHYLGTVIRLNRQGWSSRCRGKWGVYHDDMDRWATIADLTPENTPFVLFAEQVTAGDFRLVFRTRADAAQFALLTFNKEN